MKAAQVRLVNEYTVRTRTNCHIGEFPTGGEKEFTHLFVAQLPTVRTSSAFDCLAKLLGSGNVFESLVYTDPDSPINKRKV